MPQSNLRDTLNEEINNVLLADKRKYRVDPVILALQSNTNEFSAKLEALVNAVSSNRPLTPDSAAARGMKEFLGRVCPAHAEQTYAELAQSIGFDPNTGQEIRRAESTNIER